MSTNKELVDNIVEEIEEQQKKFDQCDHREIKFVEEDIHWECANCGIHFETKKADSSRLPNITKNGHYTEVTVKEYNPDWVRISAILKRMDQIWSEENNETDMWYKLEDELHDMNSETDLLGSDNK